MSEYSDYTAITKFHPQSVHHPSDQNKNPNSIALVAKRYPNPSERELTKQTEDKKNKMNDTTATARDFFLVLILLLSSLCDRSYDFLLIFTMIK